MTNARMNSKSYPMTKAPEGWHEGLMSDAMWGLVKGWTPQRILDAYKDGSLVTIRGIGEAKAEKLAAAARKWQTKKAARKKTAKKNGDGRAALARAQRASNKAVAQRQALRNLVLARDSNMIDIGRGNTEPLVAYQIGSSSLDRHIEAIIEVLA